MECHTTRFQEVFCFREARRSLALADCKARDNRKMGCTFNDSFTALNVKKIMRKELGTPIGCLKAWMLNAYHSRRIIDVFEKNPNMPLNKKNVNVIFIFVADAK